MTRPLNIFHGIKDTMNSKHGHKELPAADRLGETRWGLRPNEGEPSGGAGGGGGSDHRVQMHTSVNNSTTHNNK